MTKEQEIFKNMKKRGRIHKAYGKWIIDYGALICSIKEAGYTEDEIILKIIDGMKANGYIRQSKDIWGRTNEEQSCCKRIGNYIIEKWVN